jgi:transcriptional regulator with XRE-family HTH domain
VSRGIVPARKKEEVPVYAKRINALRTGLKLNQQAFAKALRVDQTTISKWESGKLRPSPDMFLRLAKRADGVEKLYFLDEAGLPPNFLTGGPMTQGVFNAATEMVADSLLPSDKTLVVFQSKSNLRNVPLITHSKDLGDVNAPMDLAIAIPSEWLPKNADVQAVRVSERIAPFAIGELICLVDVSRRDPDRLRGCVVAVRTSDGIAPMRLREDDHTYVLVPLHPESKYTMHLLRATGDWSIVGRVVRWIGDAPSTEAENEKSAMGRGRR